MTGTKADEDLFAQLYRRHYNDVLAYVARRAQGADPADVVAEAFLVAWRKLDAAASGGLPWLFRTAAFALRNAQRGQFREQRMVLKLAAQPDLSAAPDPADTYATRNLVMQALNSLSPRDRELILLVEWERLEVRSAALVVGISTGAARVRIHRARRRLATLLEPNSDRLIPREVTS